ncbi:MAG: glycoside hydrolase family 3 C-terminal domain-containing protein [Clostridia bacterium]|nr:glycoside hydrolase family 3 C-terminal domain-containing protein [Clostridia bacterium]
MDKFARLKYLPCLPLGEDGRRVTGSDEHIALSRRAAGEGMVLLKNERSTLPLAVGTHVALFGQASLQYIKGGGGSGRVHCAYVRSVYDGFEQKQGEGKVKVFAPLRDFYQSYVDLENKRIKEAYDGDGYKEVLAIRDEVEYELALAEFVRETRIREAEIPDGLFAEARAFADTAIVTIGRFSEEGLDRDGSKGDYYLSDSEAKLIDRVKKTFDRCIIVLDVGGVVDSEWFARDDGIDAVLLGWQAGMEGGGAIADVILGDVDPCGRLTDTFARSLDDYPFASHFNDSVDHVDYTEDIFVGYRYFESFPEARNKVNYPFGFGLSYTEFKLDELSASEENGVITFSVRVTNTGSRAGKEVVQVYSSSPQGILGKPAIELRAFAKTGLLAPNESVKLEMTCRTGDLASFDDLGKIQRSAWILEKGSYGFYVGTSVRDTVKLDYTFEVEKDVVVRQSESLCAPTALKERLLADGSLEELPLGEVRRRYGVNRPITAQKPTETVRLDRVGTDCDLDPFIAQFTDEELCGFMGGYHDAGVSNTGSFAGLGRLGVPGLPTADGPAGLRTVENCGVLTTAWPCATLLACTWDTDLMEEVGRAAGREIKENNLAVWLAPAVNIHRNPYCGRNFEYLSEDPLVSGKMAAAEIRGIQSNNVACSVKHFACNSKEINRFASDSRISERALREVYLKAFEICVREADPWTIMTSYNCLNGIHTSENYELITCILRGEWGFRGMVTTDWGIKNDPVSEVKAGNDMKMDFGYPDELMAALKTGELTRADLEACARRILNVYLRFD